MLMAEVDIQKMSFSQQDPTDYINLQGCCLACQIQDLVFAISWRCALETNNLSPCFCIFMTAEYLPPKSIKHLTR